MQVPLAKPSILLGVNQTIMMVLSVVIIAGLIGAAGLGQEVVFALGKQQIGRGVVAGVCIMLLAVSIDRITQAMGSGSANEGPGRYRVARPDTDACRACSSRQGRPEGKGIG